jgi:hypothetical protein
MVNFFLFLFFPRLRIDNQNIYIADVMFDIKENKITCTGTKRYITSNIILFVLQIFTKSIQLWATNHR